MRVVGKEVRQPVVYVVGEVEGRRLINSDFMFTIDTIFDCYDVKLRRLPVYRAKDLIATLMISAKQ